MLSHDLLQDPILWYTVSFLLFCFFAIKPLKQKVKGAIDGHKGVIETYFKEAEDLVINAQTHLTAVQEKANTLEASVQEIHGKAALQISRRQTALERAAADSETLRKTLLERQIRQLEDSAAAKVQEVVVKALFTKVRASLAHMPESQQQDIVRRAAVHLRHLS